MIESNKPQAADTAGGGGIGNIDNQRGHPGKGGDNELKPENNAPSPQGEKTDSTRHATEDGSDRTQGRSDLNVYERLSEKDKTPTDDAGW